MGARVALRISARLVSSALALTVVAACGSEKPAASPLVQAVSVIAKTTLGRKAAKDGGGAAPAAQPMTLADLEKLGAPVLYVTIAARGFETLLTPSDVKGNVVTWATSDGTTISLRDGIVIQTRGLGPDLMSAQVPTVSQLLTPGGTHQRQYFFLGADDQGTRRSYDCTVEIKGKETIDILGRNHAATHVIETCARPQGSMSNEFWIEGTTIRQSHQLVSGGAGYGDFTKVID